MSDTYHIHLMPHDRKIKAKSGTSLMESLMGQSIFLRSDCGGKGTCGKCRVKKILDKGSSENICACTHRVSEDIRIEIPETSLLSDHVLSKASVTFPDIFTARFPGSGGEPCYGIAADLGTTTIALYLCNTTTGQVMSSIAVKNPQCLYGDDVMSRIGAIGQDKKALGQLQTLVVRAMEWGMGKLLAAGDLEENRIAKMVVVGNPTMIHILLGVDPGSIGVSPYEPAFYDPVNICSTDLNFALPAFSVQTLPQVSGFIGGDILGAALAVDLENQPEGTLLVDLGTNGELLLKTQDRFLATSCATGPAFEGASLSCGMQAISGAINKVVIDNAADLPGYSMINASVSIQQKPSGICGTGVISAVSQFCRKGIIAPGGAFKQNHPSPAMATDARGKLRYTVAPEADSHNGSGIFISQKDIRSVQLGKAALIAGIEFLLREAGLETPEKIIIAGAFGSFLDTEDMMTLGMIPVMDLHRVASSGNSAGAGSIMVLCDDFFLEKSIRMAKRITTIDLACNQDFQEVFIKRLSFPVPAA